MDKQLKMLSPEKMMELILQSVGESDLFRNNLERELVKIVLQMALEKGDFIHFVEYYGCRIDANDIEIYFKDLLVGMFGEELYQEFVKEYYGGFYI